MIPSLLVAALLPGQVEPDAATVLARLDLTSFANSTGPRHLPRPSTPEAAGFTLAMSQNDIATRVNPTEPWFISLTILAVEGEVIHACFSDVARNSGDYFVQTSLIIMPTIDGYRATAGPPRTDCREMRGLSDAMASD